MRLNFKELGFRQSIESWIWVCPKIVDSGIFYHFLMEKRWALDGSCQLNPGGPSRRGLYQECWVSKLDQHPPAESRFKYNRDPRQATVGGHGVIFNIRNIEPSILIIFPLCPH